MHVKYMLLNVFSRYSDSNNYSNDNLSFGHYNDDIILLFLIIDENRTLTRIIIFKKKTDFYFFFFGIGFNTILP